MQQLILLTFSDGHRLLVLLCAGDPYVKNHYLSYISYVKAHRVSVLMSVTTE